MLCGAGTRVWTPRTTPTARTHAYGLLSAVCATAVTDGHLLANPCSIPRASHRPTRRQRGPGCAGVRLSRYGARMSARTPARQNFLQNWRNCSAFLWTWAPTRLGLDAASARSSEDALAAGQAAHLSWRSRPGLRVRSKEPARTRPSFPGEFPQSLCAAKELRRFAEERAMSSKSSARSKKPARSPSWPSPRTAR